MSETLEKFGTALKKRFLSFGVPVIRTIPVERLGSAYGGWIIPRGMFMPNSVCYCVGVGEDASFDVELMKRFGCEVYAFDPTPRSGEYVRRHLDGNSLYHFFPVGLWVRDEKVRFYAPEHSGDVSHSISNLQDTDLFFECDCRKLSSLMRELGHTKIDLLKMDIEGAEYEVIDNILAERLPVEVLCVEFNQPVPFIEVWRRIRSLKKAGYVVVGKEGWNYTFMIRRSGEARRANDRLKDVPGATR